MSKVIELLEKIGQDAALRSSQGNVVTQALARSEISPEIANALASGDQGQLVALLGARTNVACMVFPAKQDDDDSKESPDRDDDRDAPAETEQPVGMQQREVALAS